MRESMPCLYSLFRRHTVSVCVPRSWCVLIFGCETDLLVDAGNRIVFFDT